MPSSCPPHPDAYLRYRPDIDGLRAIAVVAVVLFHGGVPGIDGGFVGVDVFFVISGYLITSIILPDIEARTFSLARFYQRRVRRIFPALIMVVAASLLAGLVLLAPADYKTLGERVIAASLFVSNVFFWKQVSYFAGPASENPLLHTWSLSIEEQFYLFYPLFLIIVSRFGRTIRATAMIAGLSLSLAACCVMIAYQPSATFFLGPTRAWELLTGGIIAAGIVPQSRPELSSVAGIIGLVLICSSIIVLTPAVPYPGYAAVLPVSGTALLLWSGQHGSSPAHRLLSTLPFLVIGRASYSFYLWHFPFFAFYEYVALGKPDWAHSALIISASYITAEISLRHIENPFRFNITKVAVPRYVAGATLTMALIGAVGAWIALSDGLPSRMDAVSSKYLDAEARRRQAPSRMHERGPENCPAFTCLHPWCRWRAP